MDRLPLVLTVDETARVLRVCKKTVYQLIRDGGLECVVVRGSYRIATAELKRFIERGGRPCERPCEK